MFARRTAFQSHQGARLQPKKCGDEAAAGQRQDFGIETDTDCLDPRRDSRAVRLDKIHHFTLLTADSRVSRKLPEQHMPGQLSMPKKYSAIREHPFQCF